MFYKICIISILLCITTCVYAESCTNDKVIFCYYSSWAVYRPLFGKYNISNIDPHICTHYVFSFAGLSIDGKMMSLDPGNDLPESGGLQQFYYFRQLREQNPCIKVLLSVGGWNEGSMKYSVMAETAESRKIFIDHALRFLIYYGFDGIDVDWEYPTQRGGIPADRQNFALLLKELKQRLAPRNMLVSTAVGAGIGYVTDAYDVAEISKHVDYILLMTYDYQQPDRTSYMAPLRLASNDTKTGSVVESVEKWLQLGCPPSKLVLGIQTSGRTYTLSSANNNGVGAPVKGPGIQGMLTEIEGFLSYYEVCYFIMSENWKVTYNEAPYASIYATKGDQWITYEDARTIKLKSKYAVEKKLAGLLVWTIDTDDFYPLCGKENALQHAMREALGLPALQK